MRGRWLGLAVLALPCLVYSMDLTLLDLAVPRIVADLRPDPAAQLWILDVYGFVLAGALITMGALGDRIGRRRVLLAGAVGFIVASIAAALARSVPMLIASRAVMGLAGATLAPSTLGLIRAMFPEERERRFAIGIWAASFSTGAALGPPLGGLLLEHLPWNAIFLAAVPGMVLLVAAGRAVLPEARERASHRIDVASACLALGATLAVIYGVKHVVTRGYSAPAAVAIVAGTAGWVGFVRRQRRLAHPLIDLGLFQRPPFVTAVVAYSVAVFVAFGTYFQLAQYLQLGLHLSPFWAGVALLPASGGFLAGSLFAPVVASRLRPIVVIAASLALAAFGLVGLAMSDGLVGVELGSSVMAIGLAQVSTLATAIVVDSAPSDRASAASAVSETAAELGGALGIALLGSLGAAVSRTTAFDPHAFTIVALAAAAIMFAAAACIMPVAIRATLAASGRRGSGCSRPRPPLGGTAP
jgi:MFS transporter, DHA2 family, multidrug resistance protein